MGLGHVHLKSGDFKAAEKAFRQALRKRKKYAPALNGLGLVFRNTDKMLDWAIKYFRSAYQADRGYIEAYENLAHVYRTIGDTKELDTYQKLVKVDPLHSDAWYQIGRIYTYGAAGRNRNAQKAEASYRRQLTVEPQHVGARTNLGRFLRESGQMDEALAMLNPVAVTSNTYQRRALLELVEIHQSARDHDLAEALLNTYVEGLESNEQAIYFDLSLVAIGEELTGFLKAAEEERIALSEAFWAGRDPAPATDANERWIEHCRRVMWRMRCEHYGGHVFPWDARGEVYVRYGRPDHVSSSDDIRFETDPEVLAVKDRQINQAGGALQHLLLSRRMINVYGGKPGLDDRETLTTILGYPVYPVRGIWEYWIFTNVGRGVEVTFVQDRTPGPFKFAEMPHASDGLWADEITGLNPYSEPGIETFDGLRENKPRTEIQFGSNLTWQHMNPGLVIHRVALRTPEGVRAGFRHGPS